MKNTQEQKGTLFQIALVSLILFFNLTARTVFSPLLPTIESDLHISHAEGGSLFLLISLGYALTMLFSGFVSSRIGHRGTILLSTFGATSALGVITIMPSLLGVRLALLALGMFIGLYFPSGVATVTALARPENSGRAIALHELGPNLSFVLAPIIAELLLRVTGWRGVLAYVSIGGVVIGLLFLVLGRGGRFRGAAPNLSNVGRIISQRAFWIIAAVTALAASAMIGVYSMLPLYLIVEKGYATTLVNGLVSASRVSGLLMLFVVGFLVDRLGARRLMVVIGALVGVLTILIGVTPSGWLLPVVFLQPMLVGSFFPASISALTRLTPREEQNVAVSLMVPMVFLFGGGVSPVLLGVLGETVGFGPGFVVMGSLFVALLPLLFFLKLPQK